MELVSLAIPCSQDQQLTFSASSSAPAKSLSDALLADRFDQRT
jgi:hypothetical protein